MTNPILLEIPEELLSQRLALRMPRPGQGRAIAEAINASLGELRPFMSFAQSKTTPEACELELRRDHAAFILRERLMFQVFLRSSDVFLGEIGFRRLNWDVPKFEISYWLDSRHTGQGFMTEAAHTLIQCAFETLGAARVDIRCASSNAASRRVAEKLRFTLEATLRNSMVCSDGSPADECVYARVHP